MGLGHDQYGNMVAKVTQQELEAKLLDIDAITHDRVTHTHTHGIRSCSQRLALTLMTRNLVEEHCRVGRACAVTLGILTLLTKKRLSWLHWVSRWLTSSIGHQTQTAYCHSGTARSLVDAVHEEDVFREHLVRYLSMSMPQMTAIYRMKCIVQRLFLNIWPVRAGCGLDNLGNLWFYLHFQHEPDAVAAAWRKCMIIKPTCASRLAGMAVYQVIGRACYPQGYAAAFRSASLASKSKGPTL
eukprot:5628875-Amphidinium_carterae.1